MPRPSPVYLLVGVVSWPIVRFLFRYRASGVEHVPRRGGVVLASNHLSNFDPWAVGLALFPWRFLRFMAKSELFWFPLGAFIKAGGAFRVRRGQADIEAIETGVQLARGGHAVMMFPEGTRREKGLVKKHQARAHTGAARIALEAGVPLVPVAVKGTDSLLQLGPLRVAYGPPIALDDLGNGDLRERSQLATERLMASIGELEKSL